MNEKNLGGESPLFHIVLVEPEIPGNTGSIGRTCLALNAHLHLIHPLGFDLSEKSVRRAGLDYWREVKVSEYQSFDEFVTKVSPSSLIFFSAKNSEHNHYSAPYKRNCALIFGKESVGLPIGLINKYSKGPYHLPMLSQSIRSLNLASVATAVGYEALRQITTQN